ncbi:uncharacterized protein Z519_09594 [Cladophialophora bantiana CBS 173.52]|uniref:NACHT domain-containing protein n=1 Tax=Cladophialophora bantiana (strain ATCC 10958 / CBS 173.52 / CDC B-1940 / NIH 8579) TaxID=1442370 RepID=A0A0D2H813_CLAB1|nr:uncharacterized protein Z519_09594 [Cladophialophora bantiana CBS 173.52]KIW89438.1 hypothetical protein Z519_09594 [Cladophialophora bantiana CBS 173.52]
MNRARKRVQALPQWKQLDAKMKSMFETTSLEVALAVVTDLDVCHAGRSHSRRATTALKPFISYLGEYFPAIDALAQMNTTILSPIWGSLLRKFADFYDEIADMIKRITDSLPRMRTYAELHPESKTLQDALANVYAAMLEFFITVAYYLQDYNPKISQSSALGKLKEKFSRSASHTSKSVNVAFNAELRSSLNRIINSIVYEMSNLELEARSNHELQSATFRNYALHELDLTHKANVSSDWHNLFEWLSADDADYRLRLSRARDLRHEGTCSWIDANPAIRSFLGHQKSRSVWVTGKLGSGKTVMMAYLVGKIQASTQHNNYEDRIAYFFCDNKASAESGSTALALHRALIQQLIHGQIQNQRVLDIVMGAFNRRFARLATLEELEELLSHLILHWTTTSAYVYLFVDALDESPEWREILHQVNRLISGSSGSDYLKICVASRPQIEVAKILSGVQKIVMSSENIDADIAKIVPTCVKQITEHHGISDTTTEAAITKSLTKANNGLFIWTRMMTEFLLQLPSLSDVSSVLDSNPDGLTELYLNILSNIAGKLKKQRRKFELSRKIFTWLSCSLRPLSVNGLEEAVALDSTGAQSNTRLFEKLVPEICGPFVELALLKSNGDPESLCLQFVHLSVKEFFLTQGTFCDSSAEVPADCEAFFAEEKAAHCWAAERCLDYLLSQGRGLKLKTRTNEGWNPNRFGFYEYSTLKWISHFVSSGQLGIPLLAKLQAFRESPQALIWLNHARAVRSQNETTSGNILLLQSYLNGWSENIAGSKTENGGGSSQHGWLREYLVNLLQKMAENAILDHGELSSQYSNATHLLAAVLALQGRNNEASKLFHRCRMILEQLEPSNEEVQLQLWEVTASLIRIYRIQDQLQEALDLYSDLRHRFPAPKLHNNEEIRIYENLALLQRSLGALSESESTYKTVFNAWASLHGGESTNTLRAVDGLAAVHDMQGRLHEAEKSYTRVLEAYGKILDPSHPECLRTLHNLGSVYEYQCRFEEAETVYRQAWEGRSRLIGPSKPQTLTTMHNLALVLEQQERLEEAEEMCKDVLEHRTKVLKDPHSDIGRAQNSLGSVYMRLGRFDLAQTLFEGALDTKQRSLPGSHPSIMVTQNAIACLEIYQGHYAEALELLNLVYEAWVQVFGANHLSALSIQHNAGIAYAGLREWEAAAKKFRIAWTGRSGALGPNNILTLRSKVNLASVNGWYLSQSDTNGSCDSDLQFQTDKQAEQPLLLLEEANDQHKDATSNHLIERTTRNLDKAIVMNNLLTLYREDDGADNASKRSHLSKELKQVLSDIAGQDCVHDILSKKILAFVSSNIERDTSGIIFDNRPERLRDIR